MISSKRAIIAMVIGGSVAFTADSHAADDDSFALTPEQLFSATVISVSKTPEKVMDAPAAIFVLTNEDIMRSGATSIAEALRLVPGVQVSRTHASGWAVTIRGFANTGLGNKLLVLMDGREVYDHLFSGVYWDVQDTPLEDIDRIEVIRGPGAVLWGANAVNGVINIITKNTRETQGGMVSAVAGNQDRAITTIRYGGEINNRFYYRAYAKYLNRDEERNLNGTGAHDRQRAYRSGFRSDWKNDSGSDSFTFQGDMYNNDEGQFRITPLLALTREQIHTTGWNMLGRWTRELGNDSRLTVQSYIDYTYRDQFYLADQRTSYDLDAQYELPQMGRNKMIAGLRYRLSNDKISPSAFATTLHPTRNDQLFSGFMQDKITLNPGKWFLTLGSKLEYNDYSGVEIQPNARLQWHIDEAQMAWASVARAVRTPSQLEQDFTITSISTLFGIQANPQFESEELLAYELGYRRRFTPKLSLDLATFYNQYDGLETVSVTSGSFPTTVTLTNGTTAESYGGEAMLDWRASDKLRFSGSYSLLNLQMHGPAAGAINAEVGEGQSPQQQFNVRSMWDISDNLSLDTMLYYVDALPDFKVKHYWRLDVNLGWKIANGVQFNLVGQNLFSSPHREFISPTEPFTPATRIEPSLYGKLTWQF